MNTLDLIYLHLADEMGKKSIIKSQRHKLSLIKS